MLQDKLFRVRKANEITEHHPASDARALAPNPPSRQSDRRAHPIKMFSPSPRGWPGATAAVPGSPEPVPKYRVNRVRPSRLGRDPASQDGDAAFANGVDVF